MTNAFRNSIDDHTRVIGAMREQVGLFEKIAMRLCACFAKGGRLYVFGNGGSAADAQHIAAELVGRFKHDRRALPAVALTTDTSALTAIANDIGFEEVYARQVRAMVTACDVVWALSVSGRSPNVLAALRAARQIGATTLGFTGRGGDELAGLCDLCFRADHDQADRVQEAHQLAYHLICEAVEQHSLDG